MTARLEARISEKTMKKLENLKSETGLSKTEIIEDLINYSRTSDFKMLTPTQEEKEEEKNMLIQLIATRKYLSYLYKNMTTNMNQIAHVLNRAGINKNNENDVKLAFDYMTKKVNELTNKIKEETKIKEVKKND